MRAPAGTGGTISASHRRGTAARGPYIRIFRRSSGGQARPHRLVRAAAMTGLPRSDTRRDGYARLLRMSGAHRQNGKARMAGGTSERTRGEGAVGKREGRAVPIGRLILYYAVLLAIGFALIELVPGARAALIAPIAAPPADRGEIFTSGGLPASPWPGSGGRGALALVAALGALALALPVAWAHMWTRRGRHDPSLVQTIIVLPVVVAGVVLVVRNSLALAFALTGIVAGVRFRQKLNEPQDAVYVLLALGIGLAAGVQALDVAFVLSMVFNIVVLAMWRVDFGAPDAVSEPPGTRGEYE